MAIHIDIPADLNGEDETGMVWTFLDEAADPALIVPGAIAIAGDEHAPAVAEVVDVVEKAAGPVVHLRVLPGRSRTTKPSSAAPSLSRQAEPGPNQQARRPPAAGPSSVRNATSNRTGVSPRDS